MGAVRILPAMLGAVLATFGLFWLMQRMVLQDAAGLQEPPEVSTIEFVRLEREPQEKLRKKERRPPEKPPEAKPKPRPERRPTPKAARPQPQLNAPDAPAIRVPLDVAGIDLDGLAVAEPAPAPVNTGPEEAVPVSQVPPRYPRRAVMQGVEGWVRLEFTINETGGVEDIRVVEAKPRGYFERAARRALLRWRFRPKQVDGEATSRRAVQVIRFRLDS